MVKAATDYPIEEVIEAVVEEAAVEAFLVVVEVTDLTGGTEMHNFWVYIPYRSWGLSFPLAFIMFQ